MDIDQEKHLQFIEKKSGKLIHEQGLLQADDHVLIGLSGGKDSLVLADVLSKRLKILPFKIKLTAAHVFITNIGYQVDHDYLDRFCRERGIDFMLKSFEVVPENNKSKCFTCSWYRRKTLFQLTEELNCQKLAFGHHMDDAIETLLMNMVYHGSVSALPYKLKMFGGRIEVIRPLLEFTDQQLKMYATIKGYPGEVKTCPESEKTGREEVKSLIDRLENMHKDARVNIFRCVNKQFPDYLPLKDNVKKSKGAER